ncbi:unnamed protein product [Callosobruchus maculatus]|uniref:Secreted protein n=1 Tax=Callosobruchus maculatus TaxID=64391 RepID=A0A653DGX2_CALMS|nr:unnamed protein product [Callosobruchus maculatus]
MKICSRIGCPATLFCMIHLVYAASLHCYSCVNCTGIDEDITDIVDCESGEVVVGGKTRETKQEHNGTASSMNFTVINLQLQVPQTYIRRNV